MIEQLLGELSGTWNWALSQLSWSGELNWVKIVVLVLAFLGCLMLLRNLLGGGHSVGGGGSTIVYPQDRQEGLSTKYYVGSSKLSDFSIPGEVYDFKVPSPEPNLSNLRRPLNLNMDLASKLFVSPVGREAVSSTENSSDSVESSRHNRDDSESGSPTGVSVEEHSNLSNDYKVSRNLGAPLTFKPDWELAQKLFVPRLRRK